MNFDQVQAIAADVRYWAEARSIGTYMEGDLNGMCAIASAELWKQLDVAWIGAEIHVWSSEHDESAHVFLVVDDHVVDITATQFRPLRNIEVFIEHVKEAERFPWYNSSEVFDNPEKLIAYQKRVSWSKDQIAYSR